MEMMNKSEFLMELEKNLRRLKSQERNKFLNYYDEMIEDYKENGYKEEDAVNKIGNPQSIAAEIIENKNTIIIKIPSINNKKINSLLLILGFPLWGSLLLSAILLIISVYVIIWCLPFATGISCVGFLFASILSIIGSPFLMADTLSVGIVQLGIGVASIGVCILLGFATLYFTGKFKGITKSFTTKLYGVFKEKVVKL
jgi:uncharacterized membrane protein